MLHMIYYVCSFIYTFIHLQYKDYTERAPPTMTKEEIDKLFNIDPELENIFLQKGIKQIEEIYLENKWQQEKYSIMLSKLKKYFLSNIEVYIYKYVYSYAYYI